MRESVSTGFGMSIDFTHNCLQGNWLLHDCDSGLLTHSVIRIVQFLGAIASLLSNQEKTNHFWKYRQLHYDLMTWWPMKGLDYIMTNERTWLPMRVLDDLMTYDVWTIWNIWKMAANQKWRSHLLTTSGLVRNDAASELTEIWNESATELDHFVP